MKQQAQRKQSEDYSPTFIAMLERMFDRIPVPVILLEKDTRIVMINRMFVDFLGRTKDEIIGKPVLEVDKMSRFPDVIETKTAEIAGSIHSRMVERRLCTAFPFLMITTSYCLALAYCCFRIWPSSTDSFVKIVS
ncbi:hypothetical protein JCM19045_133 [Bacillus sp. JCM 19045]|nr:hypothetical protein JCM19045_133 [Bacillus sp. JCM 19045]